MFFRKGTETGQRTPARSAGTEAQLRELRVKARRRLIGALALVLAAFIVVPWLFDEPVSDDAHAPIVVPAPVAGLPPAADQPAAQPDAASGAVQDPHAAGTVPAPGAEPAEPPQAPAQAQPPAVATAPTPAALVTSTNEAPRSLRYRVLPPSAVTYRSAKPSLS